MPHRVHKYIKLFHRKLITCRSMWLLMNICPLFREGTLILRLSCCIIWICKSKIWQILSACWCILYKSIVGLKRLKRGRDDEGRSKEKGLRINACDNGSNRFGCEKALWVIHANQSLSVSLNGHTNMHGYQHCNNWSLL